MRVPEDVEQLLVRDLLGVEGNLDRLGVACRVRADLLVGRILGAPAGVADAGPRDARSPAEVRLDTPEAPCCECGFLCHIRQSAEPVKSLQVARWSCDRRARLPRPWP